jgi:hypothetical protein
LSLLSKLDRKKDGDRTACTIIKFNERKSFKNSVDVAVVVGVEESQSKRTFEEQEQDKTIASSFAPRLVGGSLIFVYISRADITKLIDGIDNIVVGGVSVTAVGDDEYYVDFGAGSVCQFDDPNMKE